jgi:plasmid maintenance system killer protein
MNIIETSKYKKSKSKVLKNKSQELERLENIINVILSSENLHRLLLSEYKVIYRIEKKKGALKEYYTARLNSKLRLLMKPVGNYPYNDMEIEEIIFEDIDDTHYGEG